MPPLASIFAMIAGGEACCAIAAVAYALRCRRERDRQRWLTNQFCFDSHAFSALWQREHEARHVGRWPLSDNVQTGPDMDELIPF